MAVPLGAARWVPRFYARRSIPHAPKAPVFLILTGAGRVVRPLRGPGR